jgi:hypothetical protein
MYIYFPIKTQQANATKILIAEIYFLGALLFFLTTPWLGRA